MLNKLLRVMLFMPGDDERKIRKSAELDVDAVIFDLEDGITYSHKSLAIKTIIETAKREQPKKKKPQAWIRVSHECTKDLEETITVQPNGYIIPKAESITQIIDFTTTLNKIEKTQNIPQNQTKVIPIIESSLGLQNLQNLLNVRQERIIGYAFGNADYTSNIGAQRTEEGLETLYARTKLIAEVASRGLQIIDTPYFDLKNENGLRREATKSKQLGFTGKFAIHPKQIQPIIEEFSPTDQEIRYAQAIIRAYQEHIKIGKGVFEFNGQMIDMPMIRAAQRTLLQAGIQPDSLA